MKINFESTWVKRIFALLLSIALFVFVNYENKTRFQSSNPTDGASVQSSEIITNLPIEVNIDTDHYFVSGIPDSATLRLEGPQAVLFQTLATQGFKIATPDLNELGTGSHSVELIVEGLSNDLSASISPATVNLKIEEKEIKEYDLNVVIDEDLKLADGYELLEPNLSVDFVSLSGAKETMAKVDQVVVEVTSDELEIKSDILISAPILVLDSDGNLLNVNADPSQVEIHAPVVRNKKDIPIVLKKGTGGDSKYDYSIDLAKGESESITVKGDPESIENISNFPLEVDLDGITESTLVSVPVRDLPEGITEISREKIEVLIEVKEKES